MQTIPVDDERLKTEVIERFVAELDPRTLITTRAFFAHLKPEVAERIAAHYAQFHRMLINVAMSFRDVVDEVESTTATRWDYGRKVLGESQITCELHIEMLPDHKEMEPILEALHFWEDNGVARALDTAALDLVGKYFGMEETTVEIPQQNA